jgi:hypothetical protein
MLTGVEILLERMKTNPEEFIEGGYSKWSRVIDGSWSILTEEEQTARAFQWRGHACVSTRS